MSDANHALREHLLYLLDGGGAHVHFEDAVRDFPAELRGRKPAHSPYTAWQLLEHMRIAQWDIVDFCVNPNYKEMEWPDGYWLKTSAPLDDNAWDDSVRRFTADLNRMQELVRNSRTDLLAKIPWGSGQTILREALLVADHNAYHLGELVLVRRLLGIWK
jgi:hypothetical protein